MNLVFITHPDFVGSMSQQRFAQLLVQACRERGHAAQLRQPQPHLRRRVQRGPWAKWAGYVDQYLLYPPVLRRQAARDPAGTLYVFCDQALGPWVPSLAHRPHVVHCHDLLALASALGEVPENPVSPTGRVYQRFIRRGFRRARHFISISERTREELHRLGGIEPITSEVVYNGLNHPYAPLPTAEALQRLRSEGLEPPSAGFLLHVGGGQWYKNTEGVVALYGHLAARLQAAGQAVPALWMVSPPPLPAVAALLGALPAGAQVHFCKGVAAPMLQALYSQARALLFPSLAEGFGWPIAEALACGCPVLTTGERPMTEVGGPCAHYLPRRQAAQPLHAWAEHGAGVLAAVLARPEDERQQDAQAAVRWAARFDAARAVDACLAIYARVLAAERPAPRIVAPAGPTG